MALKTQSWLYFIAAALFVIAGVISLISDGLSIKVLVGAVMAGVMVTLGLKARKAEPPSD